jgi:hypothetical protein
MPATNHNFYNLNGVRGYPVDDAALGVDDVGQPIPPAILVDCRLRFPEAAGRYAFIGGLTSAPGLATIIFLASDEPAQPTLPDASGAPTAVPIAAITVPKPFDYGRHYPIEALYPGTGGWVVFGPGAETIYSGRFSSVRQSQLLARCARPYRPPPIPSVGKEFVAGPLTGLVRILGGADIEVSRAMRKIRGRDTECLVFRLADDLGRNVLTYYAGPCAGRPESRTCPRPALEAINGVSPDCAGNIEIEFRNALAAPFVGGGGITLDVATGLIDACAPPFLPDPDGRLPGTYDDLCSSESVALSESLSLGVPDTGDPLTAIGLPYQDAFDAPALAPAWQTALGMASLAASDSPSEEGGMTTDPAVPGDVGQIGWRAPLPPFHFVQPTGTGGGTPIDRAVSLNDVSRRNVLLWDDPGYTYSLGLTCRTQLQMIAGLQTNGGVVINYHQVGAELRPAYHLVLANATTNSFELLYYNGTNLTTMTGIALPEPWLLAPDVWYEIAVTTRLGATGQVVIEGTLRDPAHADLAPASLSLAVNNYLPASGKFGLGTDRARCRFAFFALQET